MLKETESGELFIFTPEGAEVARHYLALGWHQRIVSSSHYAGLTVASRRKKRGGAVQRPVESLFELAPDAPRVETRLLSQYEQWSEAA